MEKYKIFDLFIIHKVNYTHQVLLCVKPQVDVVSFLILRFDGKAPRRQSLKYDDKHFPNDI